jgi:hypothetical protein
MAAGTGAKVDTKVTPNKAEKKKQNDKLLHCRETKTWNYSTVLSESAVEFFT